MKKLCELVTIQTNTEDCVVLNVKPDSRMDLICLGCFTGDEELIRLTKGEDVTCTVWDKNGKSYSWYWGKSGYTCVTELMTKKGNMVLRCIEDDLDIRVKARKEIIIKDMGRKNHTHTIKLYNNGSYGVCCHKDGEFLRYFKEAIEAINYFRNCGYIVTYVDIGTYQISK